MVPIFTDKEFNPQTSQITYCNHITGELKFSSSSDWFQTLWPSVPCSVFKAFSASTKDQSMLMLESELHFGGLNRGI